MAQTLTQRIVSTVYTYLNMGNYYKSSLEIENAFNIASLQLYKKLRGNMVQYAPGRPSTAINPQQTNISSDAIAEMYRMYDFVGSSPIQITSPAGGKIVDIIESIEVSYDGINYYPVNIVPDNQYLMMVNNPIIPPKETRPLGRVKALLTYEIYPPLTTNISVRCLTLPSIVEFTVTEANGPIPNIIVPVTGETDWTEDKYDTLVFGIVAQLGFNLSNGVLVQSGGAMEQKDL